MTRAFRHRMTRAPRPYDTDRGQEAADLFPDHPPEIRDLLSGAGGCSPYLKSLMAKERDWLDAALDAAPATSFEAILSDVQVLDVSELGPGLRRAKRRAALLIALSDLGGVWALEEVTGALTQLADLACHRAIAASVGREIARGKLPGAVADDAETGAGMVAIAMGKMGASELNYSSDIDLICVFDDSRFDPADLPEARAAFARATRNMAALLSENTADGYVFRTDLRLRPDPAVTPVCLSMEAAERYYESVGRTWERAAYIKARAAAGDIKAGEAYLSRLTPFVFRRHLDYAAIQDAHDMRLKIREHKMPGTGRRLEGLNLKLAPGGIREIEFFTQTRQIIAGGRDPDLRLRGTVSALAALEKKGWAEGTDELTDDYRAHREVEHRVQMVADQQTHDLPTSDEGFDRLAAFMGCNARDLRADVRDRLARVSRITEGFFAPGPARAEPRVSSAAAEIVARWPSYPALRSARAAEIFERVKPEILARLSRAARPDEALTHIDGFLSGLPAGVQLFSLFDANPQLIDLIVDIAATSPGLARYLSRHSAVLDAVIGGGFFAAWPGAAWLTGDLAATIAAQPDYEAQLLAARHWRNEWHFRVGVHHLRGLINGEEAGRQYADIAEAVLAALWPPVVAEFAVKHGPPPGRGGAVLGMGSLGSVALTATSDLDLIVLYDAAQVESSDGRRPLPSRTYYARLTQSFVTALTAQMGPGRLYEVDMRLRPSGRQGPVATSLAAFQSYQRDEAWTWEHLALTRARPIAGAADIGDEVEAFRRDLLRAQRRAADVLGDVAEMRARLGAAKPGTGTWDVKSGPGRLQDIAFLAQAGALLSGSSSRGVPEQLAAGRAALGLSKDALSSLCAAHALLWKVQAAARLITPDPLDPETIGEGACRFLLRETGAATMADLEDALAAMSGDAGAIIDGCIEELKPKDGTARDG
ncbi:MAG: glutamine-synthetase adenylyltransferase [Pseudomonadota bacterium]